MAAFKGRLGVVGLSEHAEGIAKAHGLVGTILDLSIPYANVFTGSWPPKPPRPAKIVNGAVSVIKIEPAKKHWHNQSGNPALQKKSSQPTSIPVSNFPILVTAEIGTNN